LTQTLGKKAKQPLLLLRRQRVGGSFNLGKALHDKDDSTAVSLKQADANQPVDATRDRICGLDPG